MNQYEVFILDMSDKNLNSRWSLLFQADDFAHAEEQAKPYLEGRNEIVQISKDFDTE